MRSPGSSFNHCKHIDKTRDNKRCPTKRETKQKCPWGRLIIAPNPREEEVTEGKEPLFVQATLDFPSEQGTGALSLMAFLIGASAPIPIPAGWHLCVFAVSEMCHVSQGEAYPGHTHALEAFTPQQQVHLFGLGTCVGAAAAFSSFCGISRWIKPPQGWMLLLR